MTDGWLWPRLRAWSSGRNVVVLLVPVLLWNFFLMRAMVGGASGLPIDLRLFYTPQTVQALVDGYAASGQLGRLTALYLMVDVPYGLLYTAFLMLAIAWALRRSPYAAQRAAARLTLLPLAALAFDSVENLGMVATLLAHPHPLPLLAWALSAATALKWLALLSSLLCIVALLGAAAVQAFRTHRGEP